MAKIFIEETTLTSIGDAIREKEGTTDLIPVTEMSARISAISGGGGGDAPTNEELTITGSCHYMFSGTGWVWYLNKYGNKITTSGITDMSHMFKNSTISEVPFDININDCAGFTNAIAYMPNLSVCPKIRGKIKWVTNTAFTDMFVNSTKVTSFEDLFTPEMIEGFSTVKVTGAYSSPQIPAIKNCPALRTVPSWWLKFKLNESSTSYPNYSYTPYYYAFNSCTSLDEIVGIPVWKCTAAMTSNSFSNSYSSCGRAQRFTFETNADGTPIVTEWKSQTINLVDYFGYVQTYAIANVGYGGITPDKEVKDDATYQALKNDPDWFTTNPAYCRYNHDSAVETINSLPDTSAYLATAGGTNTIKFKGDAGSLTDGGAINTLTEEEIAVATSKGWTVTIS